MVRVHRFKKTGEGCRTADGAKYQLAEHGTIIRVNKDRRSAKERKRARREGK